MMLRCLLLQVCKERRCINLSEEAGNQLWGTGRVHALPRKLYGIRSACAWYGAILTWETSDKRVHHWQRSEGVYSLSLEMTLPVFKGRSMVSRNPTIWARQLSHLAACGAAMANGLRLASCRPYKPGIRVRFVASLLVRFSDWTLSFCHGF